ncbi:hypothetical protein [Algoriphagus sp.]|uniref:hypothetical protein n=1 Tax=Algoriphagus sp. TaxID=1872435 RepID=UPI003F71BDB7
MKNRSILLFFLFLISLGSCKDDGELQPINQNQSETSEKDKILDLLPDYMNNSVIEKYQNSRDIVFYHLLTNPHDPNLYFTDEQLKQMDSYDSEQSRLNLNQKEFAKMKFDEFYEDELISKDGKEIIDDFLLELDQIQNDELTVEETWSFLNKIETGLLSKQNVKEANIILSITSAAKGALQIQELTNQGIQDEKARVQLNCIFGLKTSCWINTLSKTLFDSIVGSIGAGVKADDGFWAGVESFGAIGVAISFVKNLFGAITNNNCYCSAAAINACIVPTNFNVIFDACDNTAKFQPYHLGNNNNLITYTISNGVFPEFGNAVSIPTPDRIIVGKQNTNNQQIGISASVICTGGVPQSTGTKYFDLYFLSRSPGPITISGDAIANIGFVERYVIGGTGTKNSNNNIAVSVNYAGTIVGQGYNSNNAYYVDVSWNILSSGSFNYGTVYATSTNSCSGQVLPVYMNVNVIP